jgi:hypothetical protein
MTFLAGAVGFILYEALRQYKRSAAGLPIAAGNVSIHLLLVLAVSLCAGALALLFDIDPRAGAWLGFSVPTSGAAVFGGASSGPPVEDDARPDRLSRKALFTRFISRHFALP